MGSLCLINDFECAYFINVMPILMLTHLSCLIDCRFPLLILSLIFNREKLSIFFFFLN